MFDVKHKRFSKVNWLLAKLGCVLAVCTQNKLVFAFSVIIRTFRRFNRLLDSAGCGRGAWVYAKRIKMSDINVLGCRLSFVIQIVVWAWIAAEASLQYCKRVAYSRRRVYKRKLNALAS